MTLDFNHRYFNYLLRCFKRLPWTALTVISAFTGHDLNADNWGVHSATEASLLSGELLFPLPEPPADLDYHEKGSPSAAKVELGRMLFFDKILSGNQNIS
ncbi:MAG: hypothetical protein HN758_03205, partial [Verrucomicrobia bacterium]|nr:hypothetical protein [Verrucomicrobiota bacterium]